MKTKEDLKKYLEKFRPNKKFEKKVLFDLTGQFLPLSNYYSIAFLRVLNGLGYGVEYLCSSKNNINMDLFEYNAEKFILQKNLQYFFMLIPKISIFCITNLGKFFNLDKLFHLRVEDTYVGDLIFDEYIRRKYRHTVESIDSTLLLLTLKAIYSYYLYKHILKKNDYEFVVLNSISYTQQATMARLATTMGVKVVYYRNLNFMKKYNTTLEVDTFEKRPNEKLFCKLIEIQEFARDAESFFHNRLSGIEKTYDSLDFENARKKSSGGDVSELQTIKESGKKIVVVASSCMMDSVMGNHGEKQVYGDYYKWLVNTLKYCSLNENIVTFLKPHPGESGYPTKTSVDVLSELGLSATIKLWPKLDILEVNEWVDAVITPRGTLGIEMPCLGVPVIAGCEGIYSRYGTVIEPQDDDEYKNAISRIHTIEKLSVEKKELARKLYYFTYKSEEYKRISADCMGDMVGEQFESYSDNEVLGENIDAGKVLRKDRYELIMRKLDLFNTKCFEKYSEDFLTYLSNDDLFFGECWFSKKYLDN